MKLLKKKLLVKSFRIKNQTILGKKMGTKKNNLRRKINSVLKSKQNSVLLKNTFLRLLVFQLLLKKFFANNFQWNQSLIGEHDAIVKIFWSLSLYTVRIHLKMKMYHCSYSMNDFWDILSSVGIQNHLAIHHQIHSVFETISFHDIFVIIFYDTYMSPHNQNTTW